MSSIQSLFKVAFTTISIFGKAVGQAYKQSAAQSAARKAAGISGSGVSGSFNKEFGGITLSESMDILNLKGKDAKNLVKIEEKFDYLFKINEAEKGGSFYLQSKIYRAAERLKYELKMENPELFKEAEVKKEESIETKKEVPPENAEKLKEEQK
ncbi:hypothetical protein QEN19_003196 [Hanseniaspora menglaensis]